MHLYEDFEKLNPTPETPETPTPAANSVSVNDLEAMKTALTESFANKLQAMQTKLDEFMKANNIKPLADNEVGIIPPEEPSGNNNDSKGE